MKKMILFSVLAILTLASCTKHETKVVHDGDGGGAQGIVYSIEPEDWGANDDSTALYATLDIPELSDDIIDHGAVMVYLSFQDGEYEPIPEVFDYVSYIPIQSKGQIDVEMRDIQGYKVEAPAGEIWAKIVLINAQAIEMHPNVDLDNYNEVKQVFHLK